MPPLPCEDPIRARDSGRHARVVCRRVARGDVDAVVCCTRAQLMLHQIIQAIAWRTASGIVVGEEQKLDVRVPVLREQLRKPGIETDQEAAPNTVHLENKRLRSGGEPLLLVLVQISLAIGAEMVAAIRVDIGGVKGIAVERVSLMDTNDHVHPQSTCQPPYPLQTLVNLDPIEIIAGCVIAGERRLREVDDRRAARACHPHMSPDKGFVPTDIV